MEQLGSGRNGLFSKAERMTLAGQGADDDETIDRCRLCLGRQAYSKSIFAGGAASEKIRSRILDCCPITLFEDERLPSSICQRCESKLDVTYEFRQLCRDSERVLRARYESNYRARSGTRYANSTSFGNAGTRTDENGADGCDESGSRAEGKSRNETEGESGGESEEECERSRRGSRNAEHGHRMQGREHQGDDENDAIIGSEKRSVKNVATNDAAGKGKGKGKPYVCELCKKTFASKSGLRFHFKSHNGTKPHSCRHCGKRFAIPSYLKRHERTHAGNKEFVCRICSAAFASSNGLKYHSRSHTGERNYRCETCGKSFRRYKYLKEHVFTHTGEKPFVCKRCGTAAYANSGSLFVHEKRCNVQNAD